MVTLLILVPAALYVETNLTIGHTMLNAATAANSVPQAQQAPNSAALSALTGEVQAAHPGMPDLAGVCSQYAGFALEGLGERTGDSKYFQEGVVAHRRSADSECHLFEREPNPQTQRNCADALGELSWAMHRAGQGEPAVQAASRSLALIEPVSNSEPKSARLNWILRTRIST